MFVFFFKQKTAYEMRISDWSSDVCSSDLKERALFAKLVAGAQSEALRHVFFAERAAAKIDGLPKDIALRPIGKVGVIGAGTMGGGISMNFLSPGIPVTIVEMAQDALDRGVATMRKNYEATAATGRLPAGQVQTIGRAAGREQ